MPRAHYFNMECPWEYPEIIRPAEDPWSTIMPFRIDYKNPRGMLKHLVPIITMGIDFLAFRLWSCLYHGKIVPLHHWQTLYEEENIWNALSEHLVRSSKFDVQEVTLKRPDLATPPHKTLAQCYFDASRNFYQYELLFELRMRCGEGSKNYFCNRIWNIILMQFAAIVLFTIHFLPLDFPDLMRLTKAALNLFMLDITAQIVTDLFLGFNAFQKAENTMRVWHRHTTRQMNGINKKDTLSNFKDAKVVLPSVQYTWRLEQQIRERKGGSLPKCVQMQKIRAQTHYLILREFQATDTFQEDAPFSPLKWASNIAYLGDQRYLLRTPKEHDTDSEDIREFREYSRVGCAG